jgi:hypothetical protein
MYYTSGIGLRYGVPGSFISTGKHLYCYFTNYITGISNLDFDPEEPIVFDKTHAGEEVAIGYICNPLVPVSSYRGRLVVFIVDAENDHYPECVVSNNNQGFKDDHDINMQNGIMEGPGKIVSNYMGFYIDEAIGMIASDTVKVNVTKLYPDGVSATWNCTDEN